MSHVLEQTERTRLRRKREWGFHDRQTIDAILDAYPLCHIGFIRDGSPVVMPTIQWREGDRVYWHASNGGRGVNAQEGADVCLTVSLLDGFVLARSAMHHSANYRSVMVFGKPVKIADGEEKRAKLNGLIDALYPGRREMLRPMTDVEVKQTAVLSLPLEEASAKVRGAGVIDDEADYDWPVWAGVIPVRLKTLDPVPDPRNLADIAMPDHAVSIRVG